MNLSNDLKNMKFRIIPEYSGKAPVYAKKYDKKFPVVKEGEIESKGANKVDLCIAAFYSEDLSVKRDDPSITYWYIKHDPLILMEFKFLIKSALMEEMEKDLRKLASIQKKYDEN